MCGLNNNVPLVTPTQAVRGPLPGPGVLRVDLDAVPLIGVKKGCRHH